MKLVDTHAHVNFAAYKDDVEEVLQRAAELDMGIINVGTQYTTSARAVLLANKYENVWAAVGTHPVHLKKGSFPYADSDELEATEIHTIGEEYDHAKYLALARDSKVVAIGEIGLDFHHFEDDDDVESLKTKQREVLLQFVSLANEVSKPVIIHCWDGYPELLQLLTENPVEKAGVIHSFIGGYKTARKFIELGYFIGLNGIATYSDTYKRLIREIGLDHIVLETDCPYLAPGEKKGERNEPAYVTIVAQFVADALDVSLEEVLKRTTMNAVKLFGLH
jgi:TatD DNase family protein